MQVFLSALSDAALDTLKVLPILYLAYLLVAYFSHSKSKKFTNFLNKTKYAAPCVGAFLGVVPQCGFSSVMSDLYSRRAVTLGTLIAVFIATSDEAIPIMLSEPNAIVPLLIMLALKVVFAIFFGYMVDGALWLFERGKRKKGAPIEDEEFEHGHDHCTCHGHGDHKGHCDEKNIFLDALYHTCNIAIYIFIASLLINVLVGYVGLEGITGWFGGNIYVQIVLAGLIGLIPNCVSSVFLVELYLNGGLAFGAMFAGLCVGAGVGLIILFTKNRGKYGLLQNIAIVSMLYVFGISSGMIVNLFM